METTDHVSAAAAAIREAYRTGEPLSPPRDAFPGASPQIAYAIQDKNTDVWLAEGRRLVGRKIGLTSPAVQRQLGVDQPDFGQLFADMWLGDDDAFSVDQVMQARVEAEVALVLERDIANEQPTLSDVARAIAFVAPAIEIVGSRIANWNIRFFDTVADNASSGLFVLGGPLRSLAGLELRDCAMEMRRGDDVVSTGSGAACLGSPLNAAVWLARKMVEVGRPLRAGDVVMTGALGPMVAATSGDRFAARISGLGSVRIRVAPSGAA